MKKKLTTEFDPQPTTATDGHQTDLAPEPIPEKKTRFSKNKPKYGFALGKIAKSGAPKIGVAARALAHLGESSEGNAQFLAVMSADPNPPASVKKFISEASLSEHDRHSLPRIAQITQTPIADIFLSYARGVKTLGHAQVVERVSQALAEKAEAAIGSLMDQACPQKLQCDECRGSGKDGLKTCLVCDGDGFIEILPKFWPFAQKKIYELAGIIEKGGGININTSANVSAKIGVQVSAADMLGKLISASDAVVNPSIIEAEIKGVLAESHHEPVGENRGAVLEETPEAVSVKSI